MKQSFHLAGLTLIAVCSLLTGTDPTPARDGSAAPASGPCRRAAGQAQSALRPAWALVGADATQHRDPPANVASASDSVLRAPRGACDSDQSCPAAEPAALANPPQGNGPVLDAASSARGAGRGPAAPVGRFRPLVSPPSRPLGPSWVERPRLTWVSIPFPPRSPPA
jgi:hypothetical protein